MTIYLDFFFLIAKSKSLTMWRDEIKRNPLQSYESTDKPHDTRDRIVRSLVINRKRPDNLSLSTDNYVKRRVILYYRVTAELSVTVRIMSSR